MEADGTPGRDVFVASPDDSPFDFSLSPEEREERMHAAGADVVTDGFFVAFLDGDDVDAVLNDRRFAAIAMQTLALSGVTSGPLNDFWSTLMFGKDGDEHSRLRGTVNRSFTPRAIERHRRAIEAEARSVVATVPDDSFDVFSTFSRPFASRATCVVAGLPVEDHEPIADWAFTLVLGFFAMATPEAVAAVEQAVVEFCAYLDPILDAKLAEPADDVASVVMAAHADGTLSYEEARALVANTVFGGMDATTKALTTGVYELLRHGQWPLATDSADLARHAVTEILRLDSPSRFVGRLAPEDLVCQRVRLAAGQLVLAEIHAANRDASRYPEPEVLDIGREQGRQLAFGAGEHYCLGANQAKLTMEVGLTTLSSSFPVLRLADPEAVVWEHDGFVGVTSLPVTTEPAS